MVIDQGEYSEIQGIYTDQPTVYFGRLRRNFRIYRLVIGFIALLLSFLILFCIIFALVDVERNDVRDLEENATIVEIVVPDTRSDLDTLLSLNWPLKDEEWYIEKWSTAHLGSQIGTSNSSEMNKAEICSLESEAPSHDKMDLSQTNRSEWDRCPSSIPNCSSVVIRQELKKAARQLKHLENSEQDRENQAEGLSPNSAEFFHQNLFRKTDERVKNISRHAFKMELSTINLSRRLNLTREVAIFDSSWSIGRVEDPPDCYLDHTSHSKAHCSTMKRYRQPDGHCNNLKHPDWGKSFTTFRRMLPPDYDDGIFLPRFRSKDGKSLPGSRTVSLNVHPNHHFDSKLYTHLAMSWGQFVAHDLSLAAQIKVIVQNSTVSCCNNHHNHSLSVHPECFPILIPENDHFYGQHNISCLEFARSAQDSRCLFGPRQQINHVTHFLDGSTIYGSTETDQKNLRTFKNGLLKMQITLDGRQLLLPSDATDSCNQKAQVEIGQFCFKSGDIRVNAHILLTIMHTVWTRQHNLVAEALLDLNDEWTDERIFQEARRVIIAQIQHITYNEFLPIVLGHSLYHNLNLTDKGSQDDRKQEYDPSIHPGVGNAFSTVAFRFGHSMIQGLSQRIDSTGRNVWFEQAKKYFFNPFPLYKMGTLAEFVRGEISQHSAAVDTFFTTQITEHLFQRPGVKYGLDLVSIDIQRGRDHGIPGYVRWRKNCGFSKVQNFEDLKNVMADDALDRIKSVYRHVEDIDFFTGGLAELPLKGAIVGPTFACVITDQFIRLQRGDRFWYENTGDFYHFSPEQIKEIHRTSLARILCDNIDNFGSVQRWPMVQFGTGNSRIPCSSQAIPTLDLQAWEEEPL